MSKRNAKSNDRDFNVYMTLESREYYLHEVEWYEGDDYSEFRFNLQGEVGVPQKKGKFAGTRDSIPFFGAVRGDATIGRFDELVDAVGIDAIGDETKVQIRAVVGIKQLSYFETNDDVVPYIWCTLVALESVVIRDEDGDWVEFEFETENPERSSSAKSHKDRNVADFSEARSKRNTSSSRQSYQSSKSGGKGRSKQKKRRYAQR